MRVNDHTIHSPSFVYEVRLSFAQIEYRIVKAELCYTYYSLREHAKRSC
jgi:hypothetical protein